MKLECGVSGAALTTLINQPLEIQRLVGWVNAAFLEIQESHADWNFMRESFQFNTVLGQQAYTPVQAGIPVSGTETVLGNWKKDSFRLYSTAQGVTNENFMPYYYYDTFRNLYQFSSSRLIQTRPIAFTADPDKNLLLGPVPDGVYTVNGEYFIRPYELVADTDVPVLPSQFHLVIVYRAMMHYGAFEAASEVYQRGLTEFNKMKAKLEIDQLPQITFGAPLATMDD